ncbi:peptidylprolyl isomerase [Leptolyngbya ohadii]|uniref:peptidylprolyl isomerase n=1 Tax=Leptolyngbya ohadii TaxID=1962290 RepID=UPI000B5995C5|nr:peptidylprolyl isomerase [Leptolyngbya ohadii]
MNTCLKIGSRRLGSDEIIAALVRYKLMEPLIGQMLLDEAIESITLSEQELLRALAGKMHGGESNEVPGETPENFATFLQQWCEQAGVTAEYFQAVVLRELQVQKFKQINFADQVVSEFLKRKSELDQVEYSLLQLSERSLAEEIFFLLRDEGADFAQLVEQYSMVEGDRTGSKQAMQGWIGPVSLSTLPLEIANLFRQGQPGAIYGPIAVADHFWVVRLERLILARLTDAVWLQLINGLFDRWLKAQVRSFLATPDTVEVLSD